MAVRVRKKVYDVAYEMRKQLAAELRPAVKAIRQSARAFQGSLLKKRTGKTARKIYARIAARRRHEGVKITLGATNSILQVWERGRKAYTVQPNKAAGRKALSIGKDFVRPSVRIPAAGARPVLMPAIDRNMPQLRELSARGTVKVVEQVMERQIHISG